MPRRRAFGGLGVNGNCRCRGQGRRDGHLRRNGAQAVGVDEPVRLGAAIEVIAGPGQGRVQISRGLRFPDVLPSSPGRAM